MRKGRSVRTFDGSRMDEKEAGGSFLGYISQINFYLKILLKVNSTFISTVEVTLGIYFFLHHFNISN